MLSKPAMSKKSILNFHNKFHIINGQNIYANKTKIFPKKCKITNL